MLKTIAKKCLLVMFLSLLITPMLLQKANAGVNLNYGTLGLFLDSFMIKSDFNPHKAKGFEIVNKKNSFSDKNIVEYEMSYYGEKFSVDVNQKSNKIVGLRIYSQMQHDMSKIRNKFNDLLPALTSRYGNPQDRTSQDSSILEEAKFTEDGKYKYELTATYANKHLGSCINLYIKAL